MALEDRDWYRNEASNAWWREADGASRRPSSAGGGRGRRTSVGLLLAVLVSGLVSVVAWQGYLPAIKISGGSAEAADDVPCALAARLASTSSALWVGNGA